eukprot:COSAG02_NODE_16023_length_1120_cov_1.399608_1_plen_177_part_00
MSCCAVVAACSQALLCVVVRCCPHRWRTIAIPVPPCPSASVVSRNLLATPTVFLERSAHRIQGTLRENQAMILLTVLKFCINYNVIHLHIWSEHSGKPHFDVPPVGPNLPYDREFSRAVLVACPSSPRRSARGIPDFGAKGSRIRGSELGSGHFRMISTRHTVLIISRDYCSPLLE